MTNKYTPAVFQPTVRPSWAGVLSYISEKERSDILEALIKYPEETNIQSMFWEETIKPDLEVQYQNFIRICEARGRGAKTYWGEHKLSLSSTYDEYKDNSLKVKSEDKDKSEGKSKVQYKDDNLIITEKFKVKNVPELQVYVNEMPSDVIESVEKWLIKTKLNQTIDTRFIAKQFINFARRQGRPYFKEGV